MYMFSTIHAINSITKIGQEFNNSFQCRKLIRNIRINEIIVKLSKTDMPGISAQNSRNLGYY